MATTEYAVYAHNGAAYGSQLRTVTINDNCTDNEKAAILASELINYAERNELASGSTWAVVATAVGG